MSRSHLRWLLPVLAGVAAFRIYDAWRPTDVADRGTDGLSRAVNRARPRHPAASLPASPVAAVASAQVATTPGPQASESARADDMKGNIFAIHMPPAPTEPPPAPLPPPPFVGPPVPPPPPPPPPPPDLRVIGTWQDGKGASVFVTDQRSTAQGRQGDVLFGQYKLTQLAPDHIVIRDVARRRDFTYPVPRVDPQTNPVPLP